MRQKDYCTQIEGMKKIVAYIILCSMLGAGTISAQNKWWKKFPYPRKHNLTVSPSGGVGSILINGSFKDPTSYSWTLGFDLDYTRALSEYWGLQTGLDFQYLRGGYHTTNLSSSFVAPITVSDGNSFHNEDAMFNYVTKEAQETYNLNMIEVPIRITYTNNQWFAASGIKLGIPISMKANYDYSDGIIGISEVIGTGTELTEILPLNTFEARQGHYDVCGLSSHPIGRILFVAASLEAGYRFSIGGTHALMASIYADYGINQIHAGCESNEDFISIKDGVPTYNTLMQSNEITGFNHFSVGFKCSYQFGFGYKVGDYRSKYNRQYRRRYPIMRNHTRMYYKFKNSNMMRNIRLWRKFH